MKILFFDTETTGIPKNWDAPVDKLDNWPRLVQLAWQVYDLNENLLEEHNYIIKPVGFTISSEASAVHKITTEIATDTGVDLLTILKVFSSSVKSSDLMVAHNYKYDYNIMGSELLRNGLENDLKDKEHICTMEASTDFCKIPGATGYKWPKLEELYYILFRESFNAHNALDDIKATARCFWDLSKKEILSLKKPLTSTSIINKESQKIIHSCWDISNNMNISDVRDELHKKISEVFMNFGDKKGALKEIKKIKCEKIKSEAIFYISKSLIDQGKIDESISFSKLISNVSEKNKIDYIIVKELLILRKVSSAIEIASKMVVGTYHNGWISYPIYKKDAFFEISKYHVKNGDDNSAVISHDLFKIQAVLDGFIIKMCSYLANIGKVELGHVFINHYLSKTVFDNERKQKLYKKLPVEYQKNTDNNDTDNNDIDLLLENCLEYCKSGLIDNAIELLKKEEIKTSSKGIILEIAKELIFNQNDLKNSLFVVSNYYHDHRLPFWQYEYLISESIERELPYLAYKILPSISDEDKKVEQEVEILIHLGDLNKAEDVACKHSYVKPISVDNHSYKHKQNKINYINILSSIINKHLDLNNIDKANLLFKKIDENEDLRKDNESILDKIKSKIIDKTVVSLMMNGEHDEAEKIVKEGNYYQSRYNLASMFMALGNLKKAIEHAEASGGVEDTGYYKQDAYYNIILVLLERKKIDSAIEVFKLMSYTSQTPVYSGDASDAQIPDYKEWALRKIIKLLLLQGYDTNNEINKRITLALNLCNNAPFLYKITDVIEILCMANLHARALEIIESLPDTHLLIGWPRHEKDKYFLFSNLFL